MVYSSRVASAAASALAASSPEGTSSSLTPRVTSSCVRVTNDCRDCSRFAIATPNAGEGGEASPPRWPRGSPAPGSADPVRPRPPWHDVAPGPDSGGDRWRGSSREPTAKRAPGRGLGHSLRPCSRLRETRRVPGPQRLADSEECGGPAPTQRPRGDQRGRPVRRDRPGPSCPEAAYPHDVLDRCGSQASRIPAPGSQTAPFCPSREVPRISSAWRVAA